MAENVGLFVLSGWPGNSLGALWVIMALQSIVQTGDGSYQRIIADWYFCSGFDELILTFLAAYTHTGDKQWIYLPMVSVASHMAAADISPPLSVSSRM